MKTEKNPIKSVQMVVAREDKETTNQLHVELTVETTFDIDFKEVSSEDINNLEAFNKDKTAVLNVLKLSIYLIPKTKVSSETIFKNKHKFEIIKDPKKGIDFKFDNDENSVFVVEVKVKDARPDGTKRKVITYEDSDLIDQSHS
ncbi:hypothetical protein U8527_13710 [Kordia algicida OT-1]|uniref:Uncharacterized protein n=1 Tax=Kordia algicida OT-1 TaxID=391587 RepID=A9DX34_9FLAO|nr:hypothetical protein [Kordia algicida]EDP95955.1 hypothetical protein KAOT1_07298 [Kordia algicida OT-1]